MFKICEDLVWEFVLVFDRTSSSSAPFLADATTFISFTFHIKFTLSCFFLTSGWILKNISQSEFFNSGFIFLSHLVLYVRESHLWLNVIEGTSEVLQNSSCPLFSSLPELLIFSLVRQWQGPRGLTSKSIYGKYVDWMWDRTLSAILGIPEEEQIRGGMLWKRREMRVVHVKDRDEYQWKGRGWWAEASGPGPTRRQPSHTWASKVEELFSIFYIVLILTSNHRLHWGCWGCPRILSVLLGRSGRDCFIFASLSFYPSNWSNSSKSNLLSYQFYLPPYLIQLIFRNKKLNKLCLMETSESSE